MPMNADQIQKQINSEHLILASASPRRKDLLTDAGLSFDIRAADIDEEAVPYGGDPAGYVKTLSSLKAQAIATQAQEAWVIGADTIVVADNEILGKPRNSADARAMLSALSGRGHQVYTGYAIVHQTKGISVSAAVRTQVVFKPLSAEEIHWYTDTKEPYDKAGAYGIQGIGGFMVKEIQGSYSNVVGLPICEVLETMTQLKMIRY